MSSIIDNLDNNEVLINLLIKNADSHKRRGVPPAAYGDLKTSFMEVLQEKLGAKLSKEAAAAWSKTLDVAFKTITDQMEK